mgnify:CR=1 FL=1
MSKENKPLKAIDADFVSLELDRLELNEGQLDGLPANPREILETKLDLLKKDIQAYPELMKYRMLLVYPLDNGKYIIIGGNMRIICLEVVFMLSSLSDFLLVCVLDNGIYLLTIFLQRRCWFLQKRNRLLLQNVLTRSQCRLMPLSPMCRSKLKS